MAVEALGWFVLLGMVAVVGDIASFWRGPWARLQDGGSGPRLLDYEQAEVVPL